ncbi:MAG: uroporphyrinogen-III synthase [Bacteroidota bacterium]|nr:uroporphyrinogen-III synthase [Bacteroidota bacterium]
MKIRTILVSQPRPDSERSPYFDLAKKLKLKIDFRPFIHVEEIHAREFRKSKIRINEHSAVIFTSRTAIDNYFRMCEEMRVSIDERIKYFCISESTAFYLQKYINYRKRKVLFGERRFDDLIVLLKKHQEEKFFVPLSDKHKPEIPLKLEQNNFKYSKAILYKTVISDLSDLQNVYYDILVFFSPSGIQSLFKNFPSFNQHSTKIAVFGPSTAKAAKEMGLRIDIQAPNPQSPSMTMALDNYIKKFNKQNGKK